MNYVMLFAILIMICGIIGIAYDNGIKKGRLLERLDYLDNRNNNKYDASI